MRLLCGGRLKTVIHELNGISLYKVKVFILEKHDFT